MTFLKLRRHDTVIQSVSVLKLVLTVIRSLPVANVFTIVASVSVRVIIFRVVGSSGDIILLTIVRRVSCLR